MVLVLPLVCWAAIKTLDPLAQQFDPLKSGCLEGSQRCTWEKTYGGALEDRAYGAAVLPDGGVVVSGHSRSRPGFTYAGWVLRLNRSGTIDWEKWVESARHDRVFGVTVTADGDIVSAGRSQRPGRSHDAWVFRLSPTGAVRWNRTFGGPLDDRARSVAGSENGGVIVGGFRTTGDNGAEGWIFHVDREGVKRWEWSEGGPGRQGIFNVAVLPDGGVVGVGYTETEGGSSYGLWVVRLDADGVLGWQNVYRHGKFNAATAVAVSENGRIVVAGQSGDVLADSDAWILGINADGSLEWDIVLGGPKIDNAWGITALDGDRFAVVAASASHGGGGTDAWLIGLDGRGRVLWERHYGAALWDRPTGITRTRSGDIVVVGYTTSQGAGYEDYWVLRLDKDGYLH